MSIPDLLDNIDDCLKMNKNFYEILGISKYAKDEEIRRGWPNLIFIE